MKAKTKVKPDIIDSEGSPHYITHFTDPSSITTIKAMKNLIAIVLECKKKNKPISESIEISYLVACEMLKQIGERYP
jgi:hypothetical protein